MDTNGETAANVVWLPEDPAQLVSVLQRQADGPEPFAGVAADHTKYVDGDMQQLDEIEQEACLWRA
jgi:hypothetical protein